jgi:hypothetical protein
MPESRGRPPNRRSSQTRRTQRRVPEPPLDQQNKRRLVWSVAKGAAVFLATVAGLVLGFWGAIGPPWPVAPEIRPTGCDVASPFLLPFSIKNPSALFSMANVKLVCNAFDLRVANNRFDNLQITRELGSHVAPGQVINTACSVNAPPNFIALKSQRIGVIYDDMFKSQKTYISPVFNFIKTSTGCQWVEGNIFR